MGSTRGAIRKGIKSIQYEFNKNSFKEGSSEWKREGVVSIKIITVDVNIIFMVLKFLNLKLNFEKNQLALVH